MPWNPSDQNKGKDPWGRDKPPQGPPDLHALFNQLKKKLLGSTNKGRNASNEPSEAKANLVFAGLIGLAILVLWVLSGIFIVAPAERAVILRFGKYTETVGSGPHWIPRFIESKYLINVQNISNFAYEADMLTKDENIVSVAVVVQYRIQNAKEYLFNVVDPAVSLEQATASALRQAVGHNSLDDLLTTGRSQIREQVAVQLQQIIKSYGTGLMVTDVTLQSVKPPEAVVSAFDDVIRAREDQKSYINKAETYANQVTATAKGQASRLMKEAEAYEKQTVLIAQAAVAGFLALLPEYQKAPEVTRQRMYLTTLESVLGGVNKVLLDQKSGNPLLYLPLDKMAAAAGVTPNDIKLEPTEASLLTSPSSSEATTVVGRNYPPRGRSE